MQRLSRYTIVFCLGVSLAAGCTPAPSTWSNGTSMASGERGEINSYEAVARAEVYASRGDHLQAAEEFRVATAADPDDPYLWVRLAEELLAAARAVEALEVVDSVMDDHDCHAGAWLTRAKIENATGPSEQAEAAAIQSLRCDPRNVQALNWLAELYVARHDHSGAFEFFGRALLVAPDNPQAHLGMAMAALELQRWPDAYAHLEAFTDLWPNNTNQFIGQADRYIEEDNPAVAAQILSIALKRDRDDLDRQKQLIAALWQTGDLGAIAQRLEHLPPASPDDREEAQFRACYLAAVGDGPNARQLLAPFLDAEGTESKQLSRAIDRHLRGSKASATKAKELPELCQPYTALK